MIRRMLRKIPEAWIERITPATLWIGSVISWSYAIARIIILRPTELTYIAFWKTVQWIVIGSSR